MGLPSSVHYMAPKKPVVLITLQGQKPELQSLLLTSHMDVVPVYPVFTFKSPPILTPSYYNL